MKSFEVYFGGSFYPPHIGHDQMLQVLLRKSEVEILHLVPTFQNPLKEASSIFGTTNTEDKKSLVKSMVVKWHESLLRRAVPGIEKLSIEWLEIDNAQTSYTCDSLEKIKAASSRGKKSHWVVCVGDDCLEGLPRWKSIENLLAEIDEFWIFSRGPTDEISLISKIDEKLRDKCCWRIMPDEIRDVSSTQIREILSTDASREAVERSVLPDIAKVFWAHLLES